jgi:hypothetical protein
VKPHSLILAAFSEDTAISCLIAMASTLRSTGPNRRSDADSSGGSDVPIRIALSRGYQRATQAAGGHVELFAVHDAVTSTCPTPTPAGIGR